MPVNRIGELTTGRTAKAGGLTVPIKQTIRRFAGRSLTPRQQEANAKLSGMNQVFYANQLIELLEAKLLNTDDDQLMERLKKLHELLDGVLVAN
jgi:hypothetical protein